MTPRVGLAPAIAVLFALPAGAQETDPRVRLDDFAVPAATQDGRIEQVGPKEDSLPVTAAAPDRQILAPPRSGAEPVAPDQLTGEDARGAPPQVSSPADSRKRAIASVSSTADSAPGAAVHLEGTDRCDPQLAKPDYERCLHVLETRADEFDAPEPPRLSAEEALLAQQRERERELGRNSLDVRLRMATSTNPDADLASNQELASLYLSDTGEPAPQQPAPGEEVEPSADLASVLQAIGIPVTGDPGGN